MDDTFYDPFGLGAAIVERLATVPWVAPVTSDTEDIERFARVELASFAAMRCGVTIDPPELERNAALRTDLESRALDPSEHESEWLYRPFEMSRRPYWLLHGAERIGTIAFHPHPTHPPSIEVSSVFVRPLFRRQGWASRALHVLRDHGFAVGCLRVMLAATWGNEPALRMYLAEGMWCANWKHAIKLYFQKDNTPWRVDVQGNQARFFIADRLAAVATNHGDRLGWEAEDPDDWAIESTAAVWLAVNRWPLIRSRERWEQQLESRIDDGGDFESLAHRIHAYEAHFRSKGWIVPPPNPSFNTFKAPRS